MKVPRNLSGEELAATLCRHWGYERVHQNGSHIVLETLDPFQHRVAVPAHKELRIGTLNSILREIARHKNVERQSILNSL
jgi:predicted RNA binding protein YcfA (HicA-like mRNA interferase family)